MIIENTEERFDTKVKRFYVPVEIYDDCPECGTENTHVDDYLSYPIVNGISPVHFYCVSCEEEWTQDIILRITVEEPE